MSKKSGRSRNKLPLYRLKIRPETAQDLAKITEVNNLAFGQKNEGMLVEKLRQTDRFISELSLVAELEGRIVGHVLFYPVIIRSVDSEFLSLSLGPMAVIPELQRQGIGSRLVTEGLAAAARLGHRSVIVLGHPDYYPKFGFKPASRWNIKAPFDAPDEAFMALEEIVFDSRCRAEGKLDIIVSRRRGFEISAHRPMLIQAFHRHPIKKEAIRNAVNGAFIKLEMALIMVGRKAQPYLQFRSDPVG
jgi:putative acetyltransferase